MATANPSTPELFYTATYNGKTIKHTAEADELDIIHEIAAQLPELGIEEVEAHYEETFTDCYSHAGGHYTRDTSEWVETQWSTGGVEMTASDLFDHLMDIIEWSEEPIAIVEAPAIAFNRKNLKALVADGSIFNVQFVKRTTGELRSMTCRRGVTKGQRGQGKAFSDSAKNLLTVYDMKARGYRSIPVEAIQRLSVNGQTFTFGEAA